MAFDYDLNGNITITYSTTKAKADAILEAAARSLWDDGYGNHGADGTRQWSAVTFNEKKALLDALVKRTLTDRAKSYHVKASVEAAHAQATSEQGNYDL